jgi:hypothetical protein
VFLKDAAIARIILEIYSKSAPREATNVANPETSNKITPI